MCRPHLGVDACGDVSRQCPGAPRMKCRIHATKTWPTISARFGIAENLGSPLTALHSFVQVEAGLLSVWPGQSTRSDQPTETVYPVSATIERMLMLLFPLYLSAGLFFTTWAQVSSISLCLSIFQRGFYFSHRRFMFCASLISASECCRGFDELCRVPYHLAADSVSPPRAPFYPRSKRGYYSHSV
jgi:hypothetical protein